MSILPLILFFLGMLGFLVLIYLAFAGPNVQKAQAKRLGALRRRHSASTSQIAAETQLNRILAKRNTKMDNFAGRFLPRPEMLRTRLDQTGMKWTLSQYMMVSVAISILIGIFLFLKGMPILLGLLVGSFVGLAVPHMIVGFLIKRRVNKFTVKFPDA
ncbi:MAG: type II secretion system F family protein, partial [Parasphingopyxis sp.]